jgi:hypothetical protein
LPAVYAGSGIYCSSEISAMTGYISNDSLPAVSGSSGIYRSSGKYHSYDGIQIE